MSSSVNKKIITIECADMECTVILVVTVCIMAASLVNLASTCMVIYLVRRANERDKIQRKARCGTIVQNDSFPMEPVPPPPSPSSPIQPINGTSNVSRELSRNNVSHTYDLLQDGNSSDEGGLHNVREHNRPAEGSVISDTYYSYPHGASLLLQTLHHLQPWATKNCEEEVYTPYDPAESGNKSKSVYENLTTPKRPKKPPRPKTVPTNMNLLQGTCCSSLCTPQNGDHLHIDDNHMYENGARKAVIPSLQNRISQQLKQSNEENSLEARFDDVNAKGKEGQDVDPEIDVTNEPSKVHWSRRCSPKEYPNEKLRCQDTNKMLWSSVLNFLENIVEDSTQFHRLPKIRHESGNSSLFSSQPSYISPPNWFIDSDKYDQPNSDNVTGSVQNVPILENENLSPANDNFTACLTEKLTTIAESGSVLATMREEKTPKHGSLLNLLDTKYGAACASEGSLNESVCSRPDGASAASLSDQKIIENVNDVKEKKKESKPDVPPRPIRRSHVDVVMSRWKERAKENAAKLRLKQHEPNKVQERSVPRRSSRQRKKWQVSMAPTFTYVVNELLAKPTAQRRSSRVSHSRIPPMGAESGHTPK